MRYYNFSKKRVTWDEGPGTTEVFFSVYFYTDYHLSYFREEETEPGGVINQRWSKIVYELVPIVHIEYRSKGVSKRSEAPSLYLYRERVHLSTAEDMDFLFQAQKLAIGMLNGYLPTKEDADTMKRAKDEMSGILFYPQTTKLLPPTPLPLLSEVATKYILGVIDNYLGIKRDLKTKRLKEGAEIYALKTRVLEMENALEEKTKEDNKKLGAILSSTVGAIPE